ncbi:hypothetical protein GCM10020001_112480 [Nonomuraea salmonea]
MRQASKVSRPFFIDINIGFPASGVRHPAADPVNRIARPVLKRAIAGNGPALRHMDHVFDAVGINDLSDDPIAKRTQCGLERPHRVDRCPFSH